MKEKLSSIDQDPYSEGRTVAELCQDLFRIRAEIAQDTHHPLSQKDIDFMPSLVQLLNEERILKMGLRVVNVRDTFRLHVQEAIRENTPDNPFRKLITDASYYQGLEGGVQDIKF